jgi:L-fuconolactonase
MNKVYSGNMIRNTEALNHWHKQMPTEPALEPDLPIIDAHHHLWDIPALANQYLLNDLLADIGQGHNIIATVYVEAHAMYRREGPEHMKPVGEVEFANGVASMAASGNFGNCKVADAIVAHADLMLGSQVEEVLAKQSEVAVGRLRGIRYVTPFDDSELRNFVMRPVSPHRLADPKFREGFRKMAAMGLVFDAWVYHPQLLGLQALAQCPNVVVKVGGFGMPITGLWLHERPIPTSSIELANSLKPYVETCIEKFGPDRCMFESNFPVDKQAYGYSTLWNAFKRLTSHLTSEERSNMFSRNAARVYQGLSA